MDQENTVTLEPLTLPLKDRLKYVLDEVVLEEFNQSNLFTTKTTVQLRVLKRIANMMMFPWTLIQDLKPLVPVHRYCLNTIWRLWMDVQQQLVQNKTISTPDEWNMIEKVLSKDYSRSTDLIRLSNILFKRQEIPKIEVYKLFAVDGLLGEDLQKYVFNLQYGGDEKTPLNEQEALDFKAVHARIVRCLYHEVSKRSESLLYVDVIRRTIEEIINTTPSTSDEVSEWGALYLKYLGEDLFSNIFYEIKVWKTKELEQYQAKKNQQENNSQKRKNVREDPRIKKKNRNNMSDPTLASSDYFDPSIVDLQPVRYPSPKSPPPSEKGEEDPISPESPPPSERGGEDPVEASFERLECEDENVETTSSEQGKMNP